MDLKSWLTGFALGLAGKPLLLARVPVAWLFNGVRLPGIEDVYTKEVQKTHPYAYITSFYGWAGLDYMLFCTSEAIHLYTDEDGNVRSSEGVEGSLEYHYKRGEGIGWVLQDGIPLYDFIHYPANLIRLEWSNTDVPGTDGTVYLGASDPVPTYESSWWVTVQEEKEFTTESDGTYNGAYCTFAASVSEGTTYRLTVNGESKELVGEKDTSARYLGNKWLAQSDDATYEDSGYDYCVRSGLPMRFHSRNPGTYTVKLERRENYVL